MIDQLLSWLDLSWVGQQFSSGDAIDLIVWTALFACAGFIAGRKYSESKRFMTKGFTPREIHIMYECYQASFGPYAMLWLEEDNAETGNLVEKGILYASNRTRMRNGSMQRGFKLTVDWYGYVNTHKRKFRKLYEKSEQDVSLDR